jgi:hypothetical protein
VQVDPLCHADVAVAKRVTDRATSAAPFANAPPLAMFVGFVSQYRLWIARKSPRSVGGLRRTVDGRERKAEADVIATVRGRG